MSCRYYVGCLKCGKTSDEVGVNCPVEVSEIIKVIRKNIVALTELWTHDLYLKHEGGLWVNIAESFIREHWQCDRLVQVNEWGRYAPYEKVDRNFGFVNSMDRKFTYGVENNEKWVNFTPSEKNERYNC